MGCAGARSVPAGKFGIESIDLGGLEQIPWDCAMAFSPRILLGCGRAFGAAWSSLPCGNGGSWIQGSLEMLWLWKGETEADVEHGNIQEKGGNETGICPPPSGSCWGQFWPWIWNFWEVLRKGLGKRERSIPRTFKG